MKSFKRIALIACALALAACASTPDKIVSMPTAAGVPISSGSVLANDLQSATSNLDQAIAIGALPAGDPSAACFHSILQQAGIEAIPGAPVQQSFAPKNDGLASLGSIIYIQIQQQKALKPISISPECKALVGTFVIDGASGVAKALPLNLLR